MKEEELFARRARAMRIQPPPLEAVLAEVRRRERAPRRPWNAALAVAACLALVSPLRAHHVPTTIDEGNSCPLRSYSVATTPEPLACIGAPVLVCEPEPIASSRF